MIDRKPVILRGDCHFARSQIFHRLVSAAMSEFQFESPPTVGKAKHLVPETNSKNRFTADQTANAFMGIWHGFGIARSIGKKNAVWIESEHFSCRGCRRDNGHAESPLAERAQNVAFHPVIKCHNAMTNGRELRRLIAGL